MQQEPLIPKELLIPQAYANYLYCTSHASLITGFYGLYQGTMLGFFPLKEPSVPLLGKPGFPLAVFIASINYWRNPVNGFRRYFDIFVAGICAIMQTYYAWSSPNFAKYIVILIIGAGFYPLSESARLADAPSRELLVPLSNWIQRKQLPQNLSLILSTFFHSMIHIVCNIANYVLYTA
jgi:hypothetical protein